MTTTSLKTCRVLVTSTSFGKSDPRVCTELESTVGEVIYNPFGRPLSSQELQHLLPGCDGYIAGVDRIDRAALETANRLKVIARCGVGIDSIDLLAAAEHAIVVTNTPSANAISVAELTIGFMLLLARSLHILPAETRAGKWPRTVGISLEGKTIGLLGLGAIGKQVARRLRPFNCTIVAHDPAADITFAAEHGVELREMDEVLYRADILSLHLPLLPTTRDMVNKSFLRRMKTDAFLINTARGELVDEEALFEALQNGHIRGAALDAFREEPLRSDNPLLSLPQVIATPHCGAHTDGAIDAMSWGAMRDCLAVLRAEQPMHRVA